MQFKKLSDVAADPDFGKIEDNHMLRTKILPPQT